MLSSKVKCALQVLSELEKAATEGFRLSMTDLHNRCGVDKRLISITVFGLRRKSWVKEISRKQVLVKDLASVTLYELVLDIDERICLGGPNIIEGWTEEFQEEFPRVNEINLRLQDEVEKQLSQIFLRELFSCGVRSKDVRSKRSYQRRKKKN